MGLTMLFLAHAGMRCCCLQYATWYCTICRGRIGVSCRVSSMLPFVNMTMANFYTP
jgi:hypothetical protein